MFLNWYRNCKKSNHYYDNMICFIFLTINDLSFLMRSLSILLSLLSFSFSFLSITDCLRYFSNCCTLQFRCTDSNVDIALFDSCAVIAWFPFDCRSVQRDFGSTFSPDEPTQIDFHFLLFYCSIVTLNSAIEIHSGEWFLFIFHWAKSAPCNELLCFTIELTFSLFDCSASLQFVDCRLDNLLLVEHFVGDNVIF